MVWTTVEKPHNSSQVLNQVSAVGILPCSALPRVPQPTSCSDNEAHSGALACQPSSPLTGLLQHDTCRSGVSSAFYIGKADYQEGIVWPRRMGRLNRLASGVKSLGSHAFGAAGTAWVLIQLCGWCWSAHAGLHPRQGSLAGFYLFPPVLCHYR